MAQRTPYARRSTTERTSRRIRLESIGHLKLGDPIDFAIATDMNIDGVAALDQGVKSTGRMPEYAASVVAQTSDRVRQPNTDADLEEPLGGAE